MRTQSLFAVGQIRLSQLSVYNWGSFHGLHQARIDPVGTLITGDNGAGKSTLIDGLMALLLPAGKASFNIAAAQGDRSDRSLLSYMRGSYGSAHDGATTRVRSKREGAVVTGLQALYCGDDGSIITLAALFWITQASNSLSDVKRLYVVAKRDLSLKMLLDDFGNGDVRVLKQRLKDDPTISYCENNFTEYQEVHRRLLQMDNKNASALLSRALGLKKIDDLTQLVRALVLEPSTVKNDALRVVHEFDDLVAIHDQLVDAKARQEALARLPEIQATLQRTESELASLLAEREGLAVYIAGQCVDLWGARLALMQQALDTIALEIEQLEVLQAEAVTQVEQCHESYIKAGGNRIEEIKKEIQRVREKLEETTLKASVYQQLAAELNLDAQLEPLCFANNKARAAERLNNFSKERKAVQIAFADKRALFTKKDDEKKSLTATIKEIEARPNSNIDPVFQRMRDRMVQALGLDHEQCLFIGELIDVLPEHLPWQGAIERALGGLRTTLAIPNDNYHLVTRWLNQTHTGVHVRVQVINKTGYDKKQNAPFKPDGFLRKLAWKTHPYRDWLKHHLSRFDLHCVGSTAELDDRPFSMTEQGLMHKDKGRFEKIDRFRVDDRRQWQLGFSNKSRLMLLKQDEKKISLELTALAQDAVIAQKHMDSTETRAHNWEKLTDIQWPQIDAPRWQSKAELLREMLYELEHANQDLATAKKHWEQAKQQEFSVRQERELKSRTYAVHQASCQLATKTLESYKITARPGLLDATRQLLQRRVAKFGDEQLDNVANHENKVRNRIDALHGKTSDRKQRATNEATGIMVAFRQKWEVIAREWTASLQSLPDYLEHLTELEKDGLPSLVEQFKERLNRHTTQSIATIKSRIDAEREDIAERIDTINRVLKRTEFRPGSHLKLGLKPEQFPHVKEFNQKVGLVLSQATSDDHERRFLGLQQVVEMLDRASAAATAHNLESLRLLDPRHQLAFHAEEIETESGKILDVLESSSGKSGGEKESFAGTIVAASLAYVLTPDGCDRPVYSTVFLDEAFSNTAEAVSRRVLKVFRALNIHVNLITPYKNLNLARESARALIIAERDPVNHESRLCEVTWKDIDRRQAEQKHKKMAAEAARLGVVVND